MEAVNRCAIHKSLSRALKRQSIQTTCGTSKVVAYPLRAEFFRRLPSYRVTPLAISVRISADRPLEFLRRLPIAGASLSMKIQAGLLLAVLLLTGCSSTTAPGTARRAYSGTASVGDFLRITLDPAAHTLTYTNVSNGDTGTIPYTVNVDGTYTLQDPQGVLVAAYEVPNFEIGR